jgi:hypothetical protein
MPSCRHPLLAAALTISLTAAAQEDPPRNGYDVDLDLVRPLYTTDILPGMDVPENERPGTIRWGLTTQYTNNPPRALRVRGGGGARRRAPGLSLGGHERRLHARAHGPVQHPHALPVGHAGAALRRRRLRRGGREPRPARGLPAQAGCRPRPLRRRGAAHEPQGLLLWRALAPAQHGPQPARQRGQVPLGHEPGRQRPLPRRHHHGRLDAEPRAHLPQRLPLQRPAAAARPRAERLLPLRLQQFLRRRPSPPARR